LLASGRATLVAEEPLTIRLTRVVPLPAPTRRRGAAPVRYDGQRLLLHTCCGPCATYTVGHLRAAGYILTGYWFNPNIHPSAEHDRRRESFGRFAAAVELPVLWEPGYALAEFLRLVAPNPERPTRCRICYRLRLACTARAAAAGGYDAFSTTLLISPYQDLDAIRQIGEEEGAAHGVRFHYENLRSGFAERSRLAREYGLYLQRYCGCVYSEWERSRRESAGERR